MTKKLIQTTENSVTDMQTGEVVQMQTSKVFTQKLESDKFYMTFIDYAAPLFKLKSETAKSVLTWMCCHLPYNDNKIQLTTKVRETLCKELAISPNTLTNSLKKLKELHLIDGEKGDFEINPFIHWKGTTDERLKMVQVEEIQVQFNIKLKKEKEE